MGDRLARPPTCPSCGAVGAVGNPLLTQPDESLLCLGCVKKKDR